MFTLLLAIAPTVSAFGLYGFAIFALGVASLALIYGSKKGWTRFRKKNWVHDRIKKLDEQYGENARIFNKPRRRFFYCKSKKMPAPTRFYKPKSFVTKVKDFARGNGPDEIINTAHKRGSKAKNEFAYRNAKGTIEIDTKRKEVNNLFNEIVNNSNYSKLTKKEFELKWLSRKNKN